MQNERALAFRVNVAEHADGCWLWLGGTLTTHGNTYGMFYFNAGKGILAHREAYALQHGQVPSGMVVDHLCRNGLCVRPDHLEAVPNEVNILRGEGAPAQNARKTECPRGHPLAGDNLLNRSNGKRECRTCNATRQRKENRREVASG